jgi:hypothetical protein
MACSGLTAYLLRFSRRAISRCPACWATWVLLLGACGSPRQTATPPTASPTPIRVLPLSRVIVLETTGPPPEDTTVTFVAGTYRIIVMRHGPPENIVFARIAFPPTAFGDSGQLVSVDLRPRPGVYGLDISTSIPPRSGFTVSFEYARYFSGPSRALQAYRSITAFERALAVGRLLPDNNIELLPPTEQEIDKVAAVVPGTGSFLVSAPQ